MDTEDRAESASGDDRLEVRGGEVTDNAPPRGGLRRGSAGGPGVSVGDLAVLLLKLLEFVEHAKRENPGMRGSALLPKGGPSPAPREAS